MPRRASATSFGGKRGNPPNRTKPGPGRPTKSFKHFLANLRNSAAAQKALQVAAEDSSSPNFRTAWNLLAQYDDEKPAEKQAIDSKVEVTVKIAREGKRITAS